MNAGTKVSANQTDAGGLYAGREQTLVKHFILETYLERFAHIVGSFWDTITYIDCFSGPWNVRSDRLEDSSFSTALKQLRKAKSDWRDHGRSLSLRCFFLEKETGPYQRLKQFADAATDATIETRNATLEDSIADICDFVKRGGSSSFPFIFVDPTGWTGFAMDVISPLLRFKPGEVLVNFMTGYIRRFAEHSEPGTRATFDHLFGSIDYRSRIANLAGQDREDELVRCYMDAIRKTGKFDYVCSALVLHPAKDRTHFHLIYATRNPKGVEVFKRAEKKAMEVMEQARASAQQRRRVTKTGQAEFSFDSESPLYGDYYVTLRERYLQAAYDRMQEMLTQQRRVLFDHTWAAALQFPLVWDSDLKDWIRDWRKDGSVQLEGLSSSDHVPKRDRDHWIIYNG
jgi:three-Cys-motif partner protein